MTGVRMLYFAWVREAIGVGEESVFPNAGETIAVLLDRLASESAVHASGFADRSRLRAALDQAFVPLDTVVGDAREIAIFPPVTGG